MKESPELFSEMSLAKLRQLKRTWISQIGAAEREGWLESAQRMRNKLAKVEFHIQSRQNENLNDLFG
jgi:hypothetical protein